MRGGLPQRGAQERAVQACGAALSTRMGGNSKQAHEGDISARAREKSKGGAECAEDTQEVTDHWCPCEGSFKKKKGSWIWSGV